MSSTFLLKHLILYHFQPIKHKICRLMIPFYSPESPCAVKTPVLSSFYGEIAYQKRFGVSRRVFDINNYEL